MKKQQENLTRLILIAISLTFTAALSTANAQFLDCNNNGVLDANDIALGTSYDTNLNGIPDECDIAPHIAFEAEPGDWGADSMTPPLEVQTDPAASGGQFIVAPEGVGKLNSDPPTQDNGWAAYTFYASAGTYKILGRVIITDGGSDSFWVRIVDDSQNAVATNRIIHSSGWISWNQIDDTDVWAWNEVHSTDDGNQTVHFTLQTDGDYQLQIARREDGTKLDCLLITDDLALDEDDVPDFVSFVDCNNNNFSDTHDIEAGRSQDCNGNGIPDECEPDCNGNGIPDECDVLDGTSQDINTNGIPDECDTPVEALVAYYPMDEGSGTSVTDASGNEHNGIIIGAGTSWVQGFDGTGSALDFNATPGTMIDTGTWNPSQGTGQITIALWINWKGPNDEMQGIISKANDWNPTDTMWQFEITPPRSWDELFFQQYSSNPDFNRTSLPIGQWTHLAVTFDGNNARLYLNGELKGTDIFSFGPATTAHVVIGIAHYAGLDPLNATIDNLSIYNRALFAGDILDLYAGNVHLLDCNGNGVPDANDIDDGTSQDVNVNGVPDECEADCNGNNFPDSYDIATGTSLDCNANGIPDECDLLDGTSLDANEDGMPDECGTDCNGNSVPDANDITAGTSQDINVNGVPDECEPDCNGNNFPDSYDIATGTSLDCNANGIPDECDILDGTSQDVNVNGVPDECEPDCNGNDIPDSYDIATGTSLDCNANGIPDECDILVEALVAYYPMDEGSGTSVTDASGNEHNGIIIGTGTSWVQGFDGTGSALDFNATPGTMIDTGTWNPSQGTEQITIALWINWKGPNDEMQGIISKSNDWNPTDTMWQFEITPPRSLNELFFQQYSSNPDFNRTSLPIGQWTHLAVIFDGNYARLYLNGELKGTDIFSFGPATTAHVVIGIAHYAGLDPLNATIDDLRIYNRALSTGDILDLYAGNCQLLDCNGNGVPDANDIDDGTSQDVNVNGVPDECEPDCNNNGILDVYDISSGTSQDCNANGIPDECDITAGTSQDVNTNAVPDECESDCNRNGIPDGYDISSGASLDVNEDGMPDECGIDCNGNGVPDANDIDDGTSHDVNTNGIPDECEPDCNTNSIPDDADITQGTSTDINNDTIPDECQPDIIIIPSVTFDNPALASDFRDSAPDSVTDLPPLGQTYYVEIWASDVGEENAGLTGAYLDIAFCEQSAVTDLNHGSTFTTLTAGAIEPGYVSEFGGASFSAGLGVEPQWVRLGWLEMTTVSEASTCTIELLGGSEVATWGGGTVPWEFVQLGSITLLRDCNNNGVGDDEDITTQTSLDCNNNGIPDECDIANGTSLDCNNNGVPDECDIAAGTSLDCNNNSVPDECDIAAGTSLDCNANGIPDECDIADGTSTDANTDGIPDDCQTDVRLAITAGTTDPVASSDIRTTLPQSISTAIRGSRYYLEIWATDIVDNDPNLGLGSIYVDVAFDYGTSVTQLYHSAYFDELPQGAIQPNLVTDFGGTTTAQDVGIEPEWVRIGFIEMRADVEVPACTISLMPSSQQINKQDNTAIPWEFVELDSLTLQITEPAKPYNLDGQGDIGLGDFSLFVPSWLQPVPPADIEDDFDCDCFVGVGDFSYFATAWRKSPDDPTIIYPPCPDPTCSSKSLAKASNLASAWLSDPGAPLPESQSYSADMSVEAAFELLVLDIPSAFDTASILPASVETLTQDQTYCLEVWAQDVGDTNPGLTSAYVDLNYPADSTSVVSISNKTFDIEPSGTDNGAGTIDELGGSILAEWIGTGEWVRVALVTMHADSPAPPLMTFSLSPSTTGVGSYGRGIIPWSDIYLPTVGVPPLNECDFTADGKVDIADFARLAARFEPDGDYFDDLRCLIENWLAGTTQ